MSYDPNIYPFPSYDMNRDFRTRHCTKIRTVFALPIYDKKYTRYTTHIVVSADFLKEQLKSELTCHGAQSLQRVSAECIEASTAKGILK